MNDLSNHAKAQDERSKRSFVFRCALGGTLMGLANLIPGISGATMLLITGIYMDVIHGLSECTMFRFQKRAIIMVTVICICSIGSILFFSNPMQYIMIHFRSQALSLFIGLTLGSIPTLWNMAKPITISTGVFSIITFLLFCYLSVEDVSIKYQLPWLLFFSGMIATSAMLLPGISGGYILVTLGTYMPLLQAIEQSKHVIISGDIKGLYEPSIHTLLPFSAGCIVGLIACSNIIRWLFHNYKNSTIGMVLGLLLSSTIKLWVFQNRSQQDIPKQPLQITDHLSPMTHDLFYSLAFIIIGISIALVFTQLERHLKKRSTNRQFL